MTYDFRFASGKKPLYGHTSPDTAFVIDDYPHGFRDRCKKRIWLEYKAKQGYRIVYQTSQQWYPGSGETAPPDNQLRWAKPKASVYAGVAGCLYIDAQDYVQWEQLSENASAADCESFMSEFSKADFTGIKSLAYYRTREAYAKLHGKIVMTSNGNPVPWSDHELEDARKQLGAWLAVADKAGLAFKADFAAECRDFIDGKTPAKLIDPEAWKAERKQQEDAAAAAKKEKSENTKGALTAAEFIDLLQKKIELKDRSLKLDDESKYGYVRVRFYNVPKGQEEHHNDFSWTVVGFDRRNPEMKAVKVKLEEQSNAASSSLDPNAPYEERMRARKEWALRGKSGTPQQVAEYLAKHIHKIIAELKPGVRTASYDHTFL